MIEEHFKKEEERVKGAPKRIAGRSSSQTNFKIRPEHLAINLKTEREYRERLLSEHGQTSERIS